MLVSNKEILFIMLLNQFSKPLKVQKFSFPIRMADSLSFYRKMEKQRDRLRMSWSFREEETFAFLCVKVSSFEATTAAKLFTLAKS
jgi:hypothetical protein